MTMSSDRSCYDDNLGALMLNENDFPPGFVSGHHCEDYVALEEPFAPHFVYHEKDCHVRLYARLCVLSLTDHKYYGMSNGFPSLFFLMS
jgi:hypothetical protein